MVHHHYKISICRCVNFVLSHGYKPDGGSGGATRPLPRDGGKELHGDPTVRPRSKVCTNISPPPHGGVVSAPLFKRWAKMARQLP